MAVLLQERYLGVYRMVLVGIELGAAVVWWLAVTP